MLTYEESAARRVSRVAGAAKAIAGRRGKSIAFPNEDERKPSRDGAGKDKLAALGIVHAD